MELVITPTKQRYHINIFIIGLYIRKITTESIKHVLDVNKMECLSYKGECSIHGHVHIEMFKTKLAWATDKQLQVINYVMLFKTVILLRK